MSLRAFPDYALGANRSQCGVRRYQETTSRRQLDQIGEVPSREPVRRDCPPGVARVPQPDASPPDIVSSQPGRDADPSSAGRQVRAADASSFADRTYRSRDLDEPLPGHRIPAPSPVRRGI
jgi:hypothetical protein